MDHDILLNKLYYFRGVAHKLFNSYSKRSVQKVKIDNNFGSIAEVSYSVPQGTVQGQILFIIHQQSSQSAISG